MLAPRLKRPVMPFRVKPTVMLCAILACTVLPHLFGNPHKQEKAEPQPPTFYRDVLPILQQRCQSCHRAGSIAPMPFESYEQTRRFAVAIRQDVEAKSMPPWFADPAIGEFANDPSLTSKEIATLSGWVQAGAPAGDKKDAPPPRLWAESWSIPNPDLILTMPKAVPLPAGGEVEYTYEIVPTHFAEDRWVQMAEVLPRLRSNVHHAVVYIRPPESPWLRHAPVGTPFTASTLTAPDDRRGARWTDSDILLVYAPGSSPDQWPANMAKFIPAGSDLVFQMHYTTNGRAASDQTAAGLIFSRQLPLQRALTLQLTNDHFVIPAGDPNYRVDAEFELGHEVTLSSLLPHMHVRGKDFEYRLTYPTGETQTILRVPHYDFSWQFWYDPVAEMVLPKGTKISCTAHYNNSVNNPNNPDATKEVRWGDQSWEEMMIGFFDVVFPSDMDPKLLFPEKKKSTSSDD